MKHSLKLILAPATLLIVSCTSFNNSGSDYTQPKFQPAANYKTATSSQLGISSQWWKTFQDSKLNSLQSELLSQNLDLAAAYSRRQQALARLGITSAELFPQGSATAGIQQHKSSHEGLSGSQLDEYYQQYDVGANLSYELDLWGRVRDLVNAGKADLEAADYAVADVRVTLQTQLARQYFALRFLDAEMATLRGAVETRKENVDITTERLEEGLSSELDSARATSELANARAELLSLKGARSQLENSIAVLLGRQASTFKISPHDYKGNLPSIPAGIPAALLYRRPDLAVAERKVAVATALIGVAEKERFPKFSLTGSGGSSSVSTSNFLSWSSAFFTVGPSASVPLFQGKRIKSNILLTQAQREEALKNYQKTALVAIADVESALSNLKALKEESAARNASETAATRTYDLSKLRYQEGVTSYLDVADAQRERLTAQRAAVRTRGSQFAATIQLIQSLGGGFAKHSK
ncbi:MAG: efflux transporter outer membrane subunit [Akkermansiaceae bacterium]